MCIRDSFNVLRRTLRLHQWAKNFLVFAALLLSHGYTDPTKIAAACVVFLALGLCASGTYIWNDLLDLADDRNHPSKRFRPLASGVIHIRDGVLLSLICVLGGLVLALLVLGAPIAAALLVYIILTVAYSLHFKRVLAADVILLAGLYLYRIYLGGLAIEAPLTDWLLAFSIFFFLSLGYAKRLTDIPPHKRDKEDAIPGRAYIGLDAITITALGVSAAASSIIVMALYITDEQVLQNYSSPQLLWVICLLLLYWLNRLWLLVFRGAVPSDPISFALRDRASQICGILICLVIFAAR